MTTILVIALGATIGAAARYYGSLWAVQQFGPGFPYGTLAINVVGSFILGCFLNLAAVRHDIGPQLRLLVATGFCGSFTTFSTFSFEAVALLNAGRYLSCGLYLFGSLALGVAAVMFGALLVRLLA
ncbi:MAG: fluoride efflux transporter CrcB [Kouleothrix sp.]|jgi:CrcB protein|nr:fluoride efflux transporter CrcB [Kouleothrix sp.]